VSEFLPIRIPEEDLRYLEERSRKEKIPKTSLARKFLHEKIVEERLKEAVDNYLRGIFSLGKAAEYAGISIREFIARLIELGVSLRYSLESLKDDLEASKKWAQKKKH